MKRFLAATALFLCAWTAQALQPYRSADKVAAGDLQSAVAAVEQKLTAAGFTIVGRHLPKGLPRYAAVVVTDAALADAIKAIGGSAIVGVPLRIGVTADGTVSYMNPEYWERAYLRKDYAKAEDAVKAVAAKLERALGAGTPFGGEVDAADLPAYRFMFGMERFDSANTRLADYPNFAAAVGAVQANLVRGVKDTAKVYELVYADRKLAVFGVATADPEDGEAWWAAKIGADHIAALPWEIFVVDGHVLSLYGRYRTALGWPSLGMGQFMGIARHPETTREMMEAVAGAAK